MDGDERGKRAGRAAKSLLGPLLAGLVLDGVDFLTWGPVGFYTGMVAGGAVGYWLAPELGFPARARLFAALLAGVYCTLPFTGFLPLAAVAATAAQVLVGDSPAEAETAQEMTPRAGRDPDAIDAEFESRPTADWDRQDR